MSAILLSPHNDDLLFSAYLGLRYEAQIITVFDSYAQPSRSWLRDSDRIRCMAPQRRHEDIQAAQALGLPIRFMGIPDTGHEDGGVERQMLDYWNSIGYPRPNVLIAPLWEEGGHEQHNLVAKFADQLPVPKVVLYTTYKRELGRTREGMEVTPEPSWVLKKLRALACYESQITIGELGCWPWFMDLHEYVVPEGK